MKQEVTNLAKPNSDAPQQKEQAPLRSAVTNFARFYALFGKVPYYGDREEFKRSIVRQYTRNRTESLREMTRAEYNECCAALEQLTGQDEWRKKLREELRFRRSVCLKLMQKIGIDTTGKGQRFLPESPDRRQAFRPARYRRTGTTGRKAALHRAEGRAESEGNGKETRTRSEATGPGRLCNHRPPRS